MQCKVKIGCNYEPKWFERRQTNGWYSGKNPRLDNHGMALQSCLLGTGVARLWDCGRGGQVDIKKAEQILKEKNGG